MTLTATVAVGEASRHVSGSAPYWTASARCLTSCQSMPVILQPAPVARWAKWAQDARVGKLQRDRSSEPRRTLWTLVGAVGVTLGALVIDQLGFLPWLG